MRALRVFLIDLLIVSMSKGLREMRSITCRAAAAAVATPMSAQAHLVAVKMPAYRVGVICWARRLCVQVFRVGNVDCRLKNAPLGCNPSSQALPLPA